MEFDLNADQHALTDAVRRFCTDRFPLEVARAAAGGFDRARWRELADLGVFSLTLPEASGGAGMRLIDQVLVMEELGRALVPGPLVATCLAAGLIEGVAEGDVVVALAERVEGAPILIEHLGSADIVVVLNDDSLERLDPGALDGQSLANLLDPTTPMVRLDALPAGERIGSADDAAEWRRRGSLLTAGMLLGLASATTALAADYAKDRHQFGRPIGSFQAIKHILADMFARAEVARAAVYAAGVIAGERDGDVDRAIAGARVLAGQAAIENGRSCIQVHGGVGYTWEADPHLFLKRALLHDTQIGSVAESAERLADRLVEAVQG
jgi:alkylation response protein AidB-like acyl-CoA dehydrogenase